MTTPDSPLIAAEAANNCPPREVGPQGPVSEAQVLSWPDAAREAGLPGPPLQAWTLGREEVARELVLVEGALDVLDRVAGALDPVRARSLRVELTDRGLALLARERELGGPLDVGEALRVAHAATDAARFEATVAHGALKRIVEARDADGHTEEGECDACAAFDRAINAAREIVGGAS